MTKLHRLSKRLQFSFSINNKIYNLISNIDALNSEFRVSEKLSHQTIKRLTQSVLVTSSWASNRIEWNKLTDDEVEKLYNKMNIKKLKTRDQQEVAWYLELLELVFSSYQNMTFNEWLILQFHDLMLKYTTKDIWHKWKYKFWPNRVEARDREWNLVKIIFDPTEPALTPLEMKDLIGRTLLELKNKEIHPLIIITNFIFEYLAIHPFQDWNWRTSRILTNLLLLQQWYLFTPFISHEKLIEEKKIEYYKALWKTQKTWKTKNENMSEWILFFLERIQEQVKRSIKISQKNDIEPFLSKIQQKVWETIIKYPEISRKEIQTKTNLSYHTIWQAIQKLIDMKQIERIWETRATRYKEIIK